MPGDIEKGIEAGCHSYLTKPIRIKDFMATLKEVLKWEEKSLSGSERP